MGMDIMIFAPAPFNVRVFKIPIPIIHGGKIFPPYLRVSVEADFFDIPKQGQWESRVVVGNGNKKVEEGGVWVVWQEEIIM